MMILFKMLCFIDSNLSVTLIDVGASVGQFTQDFREFFPRGTSYLFEPKRISYKQLAAKANNHYIPTQCAIGEEKATLPFHVPKSADYGELSSLYQIEENANKHYEVTNFITEEINVDKLDSFDFVQEDFLVLKIDVQGHEVQALKGAKEILKRVDLLIVEMSFIPMYSGKNETFSDCVSILKDYQLIPVIFQDYGKKINTYAFERDVIFIHRKYAHKIYHKNYSTNP